MVPNVRIVGISKTHWIFPAEWFGLDAVYDKAEPTQYITQMQTASPLAKPSLN
jgi:hypothetical protein